MTQPLAGLLIDEWVEVVPSASETTAMVFQFDQPDAAPPQSLLLAVPPDLGRAMDAVDACSRCCSRRSTSPGCAPSIPTQLASSATTCRPLYFAVNDAGDTVSTDFAALA